jgi:hypothetical protein
MRWILEQLPNAIVDQQDGEIVIATGLACTVDDRLVSVSEES